jgi:glutamate synthase (NADPH) large chain
MAETPQGRNGSVAALLPEGLPEASGLYDPRREHDACGIGLIASISNEKSHRIIADGLNILRNLEHRGAVGADARAGDGCGMLIQIPHALFAEEAQGSASPCPSPATTASASCSCRANRRSATRSSASGGRRRARKA